MTAEANSSEFDSIIRGEHSDPFSFLGMHSIDQSSGAGLTVRAFVPEAAKLWVIEADNPDSKSEMRMARDGLFVTTFEQRTQRFPYRLRAANAFGDTWDFHDPYSFQTLLSDYDLHLLKEG